ncbi:condensation domain-containing protein [Pedobacter caeni]|uniref:Condensation domain-containing protein n=1 Tax=Pedobacter caeni TaxID=288992 RepID=A0A1M5M2L9_9SPHI|nr:condensation domain-containing protein [Pedobacter caeni]SHG71476.1 Condensation domain-containing protein [Pedobacter caeni]
MIKRKLSLIEGTMYADGCTAVNVVSGVRIKGNIPEKDLHDALLKIQKRHPLLRACIVEEENGISYFMERKSISPIPVRLVTRYGDEDWEKESMAECLSPFTSKDQPLARLVWIHSEQISDLIFVCHHCICDGRSVLNMMDETLRLLAQPRLEIGAYSTFSSVEEFIPDAIKFNKANMIKVRLFAKVVNFSLKILCLKKAIKRDQPYFLHWKITRAESSMILESCKAADISVNAALSVAFLKAHQQIKQLKSYSRLYCAVDMRRFLPEVKDDMFFAFPAMIGLNLKSNLSSNLWPQARLFKEKLQKEISKIDVSKLFMYSNGLLRTVPKMSKYAKAERGAHDFTFSNMGKVTIKENYGKFEVQALHTPSTVFPFGNPTTLSSTTFRGEIDFILASDEAFLRKEDSMALKRNAMELLINQARLTPC